VRIERNAIYARADGSMAARGTGEVDELPAQLVFRAVRYTGEPVAGIPFDDARGVIRNDGGRVIATDGTHQIGEYAAGWIKRGSSGVIGTNKKDAQDTVAKIIEDAISERLNEPVANAIETMIAASARHVVRWDAWQAIDAVETAAGEASSPVRPRVKLAEWDALRDARDAERAGLEHEGRHDIRTRPDSGRRPKLDAADSEAPDRLTYLDTLALRDAVIGDDIVLEMRSHQPQAVYEMVGCRTRIVAYVSGVADAWEAIDAIDDARVNSLPRTRVETR
jgi:hypothetical protein